MNTSEESCRDKVDKWVPRIGFVVLIFGASFLYTSEIVKADVRHVVTNELNKIPLDNVETRDALLSINNHYWDESVYGNVCNYLQDYRVFCS